MLQVFCVFHLNLAYSSIEEEQRPEVVRRCYWPLLHLARKYNLPFGIEASGYTLESVATLDPHWVAELRRLTTKGTCEFIGSGYAQIIGPLVPSEVNAANLRLGHQAYQRLLELQPQIALVNEQAYSAGMIQHYLDAGYRAIIMEWNNPARSHPEWEAEWRYLPQLAGGPQGEEIPIIWNKSIAFQKFQRYAHNELELDEYVDYLAGHAGERRAFPLYGNDIEIFDFRPGRYHTEAALHEKDEWQRIEKLFQVLQADSRFQLIPPRAVLELMPAPGAGNRLQLESPEQPIPVKKQGKYNITRWAVTGRDDLGINTACWQIYEALLRKSEAGDDDWRELCYLWSSDFRTHITEQRWSAYLERLNRFAQQIGANRTRQPVSVPTASIKREADSDPLPPGCDMQRDRRYLTVETSAVKIRLNCRRGLAIDALWFKRISDQPLCGTLYHGYYDDIHWGADYYSGHLILEMPGHPKVTDLEPVNPEVTAAPDGRHVQVTGEIATPLGVVRKTLRVSCQDERVELIFQLDWPQFPIGSLRLGHITLCPTTFKRHRLFYRSHNGGGAETFHLRDREVDHGGAVTFLVSASQVLGMTGSMVELGDTRRFLRLRADKAVAAVAGMITSHAIGDTYFCRLAFSAGEVDETRRAWSCNPPSIGPREFCLAIEAAGSLPELQFERLLPNMQHSSEKQSRSHRLLPTANLSE